MKLATINLARSIEKRYGTNYYIATLFLPKDMKEAVFILYAFVRIPDEIVDNPTPGSDPKTLLIDWKTKWQTTYDTGVGDNEIMLAAREVFLRYQIPFSVSLEFIDAMIRDLSQSRYQTYADLKSYMRGSAEVVGVMLTHVFGYSDESAFAYGEKLGEAMQLTNFLRDIHDDLKTRNRIYIPKEDLDKFGVTESMLSGETKVSSIELIDLLKFEIARNRKLYQEAYPGIELLTPAAQKAVLLASRFYEGILDEIENQNYQIFNRSAKLSFYKKLVLVFSSYVRI